jgi:hypothetical protein
VAVQRHHRRKQTKALSVVRGAAIDSDCCFGNLFTNMDTVTFLILHRMISPGYAIRCLPVSMTGRTLSPIASGRVNSQATVCKRGSGVSVIGVRDASALFAF